jgi:hypothetical protein
VFVSLSLLTAPEQELLPAKLPAKFTAAEAHSPARSPVKATISQFGVAALVLVAVWTFWDGGLLPGRRWAAYPR